MILNKTHGFLFVHVPKTAGMAITRNLSRFTTPEDIQICWPFSDIDRRHAELYGLVQHSTAAEIQSAVGTGVFDPLFKFAVVRNPYERAYSLYRYLKYNWRKWAGSPIMDTFDTFDEFIASEFFQGETPDRLLNSQAFWLVDDRGHLMIDRVVRMEELESELQEVYETIGLPPPTKLEPVNASGRRGLIAKVARRIPIARPYLKRLKTVPITRPDLSAVYANETTRQIVAARYMRDFELLGYAPELPRSKAA